MTTCAMAAMACHRSRSWEVSGGSASASTIDSAPRRPPHATIALQAHQEFAPTSGSSLRPARRRWRSER